MRGDVLPAHRVLSLAAGTICASEQSVVLVDSVYERGKALFQERGVHFLTGEDRVKVGAYMIKDGHINADVVGQTAVAIAERAGVSVPKGTVVLAAEATEVGPNEPFSYEKLSPILGFYRAPDFESGVAVAKSIVEFGGRGHTSAIYTTRRDRIEHFAMSMPVFHLMANMPVSSVRRTKYAYQFYCVRAPAHLHARFYTPSGL